jgi:hypothetical protein
MKKINLLYGLVLLFIIASCTNEEVQFQEEMIDQSAMQQEPLSVAEVNDQITKLIELNGSFNWKDANDLLLWSATVHGNNILTVGYGEEKESFRIEKSTKLTSIKEDIIKTVENTTVSFTKSAQNIVIADDDILNFIDVKVTDLATVTELRKKENIRYLEPDGFVYTGNKIPTKSSKGCSQSGESISSSDYGTTSTGAKVPWNYYTHNIDDAWAYSTGRGIGVGVIDTGVSSNQAYLGSRFDDSYSSRYIQKYGTYVDSWWPWSTSTDGPNDKCGHGTSACATVGAPNYASQFIGVAYECNLISYRGTEDVVLDGYHERNGVANALKALGNRSDVKIISMSIGYPWSIGKIEDAVKYAYSKGKLIFAAGGTSTEFTNWYGVIFPASMNETVAVTGIEEGAGYDECDTCHTGTKIDFTVVMERGNNNHQPVIGFYTGEANYFGGSSVATAFTAGTAALVWAKYPSWNRDQVLQRLKEASAFYPTKNSDFGYGNIDALKAVRGY